MLNSTEMLVKGKHNQHKLLNEEIRFSKKSVHIQIFVLT